MLLSIQFPFADSRKFLENTGQLPVPVWPVPTPDDEFVRFLGSIRVRKQGGVIGWVGENDICEADNAFRFVPSPVVIDRDLELNLQLRIAFRRFYFDGQAVGKFEVGLAPKWSSRVYNLTKKQTAALLDQFLHFPVRIPDPLASPPKNNKPIAPTGAATDNQRPAAQCELALAGKYLARLYRVASTASACRASLANGTEWWVRPGLPLLFLQHDAVKEQVQIPYWTKPVSLPPEYDIDLTYCGVPYDGSSLRLWVLGIGGKADPDKARTLRLYLLRLHAEHECLRLVLRNTMSPYMSITPYSQTSDNLQFYFNKATAHIAKLESKSTAQFDQEIAEIARESMNLIHPGERDALFEALDAFNFRHSIDDKIRQYAKQLQAGTTVTIVEKMEVEHMGDKFENITGSTIATRGSTIQTTSANGDLAKALAELRQLIAQTSEKDLPPDQKAKGTDLLQGIEAEAAKEKPSKNVLRALGESLLNILTTVQPLAAAGKAAYEIIKALWT